MKKQFLVMFLVLSIFVIGSAAVLASVVTVYSPWPDEVMDRYRDLFEEMTDYTLQYINISSGEIMARLEVEADRPQADIAFGLRIVYLDPGYEKGILRSFATPENAQYVYEPYTFPDRDYAIGFYMYPLIFMYNTEYLEELGYDPPETWEDLLDPKWERMITMPHPATSGTAYTMLATVIKMYQQPHEEGADSEKGWDYIKSIAPNMGQYTRSGSAPSILTARGEYPLAIQFYDRLFRLMQEGYPVAGSYPSPIYAEPGAIAIVANSPNPEGAEVFVNFVLSKEAQELAREFGNYSVRLDVEPPLGARPLAELDVFEADEDWAGQYKNELLDRFLMHAH